MTASIQAALLSFQKDVARNGLFLKTEGKIANPASVRSRGRSEVLLSAYVALTCGRFESFLQDVFYAAADDIRLRIVASNDLRITRWEKFHWTNMHNFVVWAATQGKRLSRSDLEIKIKNYANAIAAGTVFPEAFQYTNANPKADTLREMFTRFGVSDPFGKLSLDYLDSYGRTFSANLLESSLNQFVSRRHEAAHHGRIPNLTRSDAAESDVFILALGAAIASVLESHLAGIA